MAELARLAGPTVVTTTATAIYTATRKVVVRTIDLGFSATDLVWLMLNSTSATNLLSRFSYDSTIVPVTQLSVQGFQWRGGLVLNSGDYIAADSTNGNRCYVTICGVLL